MKIYHGTKETRMTQILSRGIKPRRKNPGNWEHTYLSRPDMVYLSIAYPFYFALNAKGKKRLIVFEIETDFLDPDDFYPDEDFIVQALKAQGDKKSLSELQEQVRDDLTEYQRHWEDSIEGLGNCCYQNVIPYEAITRYCLFDFDLRPELAMLMADPVISLMNFMICREKYADLVAWMFGDVEKLKLDPFSDQIPAEELDDLWKEQREFWDKQSQNKTGIEIRELNVLV